MVASTFADPALGPQAVFRTLLDALSQPGTRRRLPDDVPPPSGLGPGLYAAALTLADFETPLWLAPELLEAVPDLRFHTGAFIVEDPAAAALAMTARGSTLPALLDFAQGSDAYPDRSTTLLIAVEAIRNDGPWSLRGPGIRDHRRLSVQGLPFDFLGQWAENHERFPRGVDLFLFEGATVVGLPRTTRIEER